MVTRTVARTDAYDACMSHNTIANAPSTGKIDDNCVVILSSPRCLSCRVVACLRVGGKTSVFTTERPRGDISSTDKGRGIYLFSARKTDFALYATQEDVHHTRIRVRRTEKSPIGHTTSGEYTRACCIGRRHRSPTLFTCRMTAPYYYAYSRFRNACIYLFFPITSSRLVYKWRWPLQYYHRANGPEKKYPVFPFERPRYVDGGSRTIEPRVCVKGDERVAGQSWVRNNRVTDRRTSTNRRRGIPKNGNKPKIRP